MRVAVVGAGMLGLTLAHRLSGRGHSVDVFEQGASLGGLAASHDYGPFIWDRFYHCILPTDASLIGLLRELGLGDELRWRHTGTGYYADGRSYDMSSNADFARFPLLSLLDKARLAATVIYAARFADPWQLYRVTAKEWLTRWCGDHTYQRFWKPLLAAKFGSYHDQVAAVFIWATLTRLFGARAAATSKEKMGYCSGGYHRILGRFEEALRARNVGLHLGKPVRRIEKNGSGCVLETADGSERYEQVIFTGPTRLARDVVKGELGEVVEQAAAAHPTSGHYLGVICLVLVLRRPLTPYYVLNVGDPRVELTGIIEMTNLVDPNAETEGLSLVYVPHYLDSGDPRFSAPDDVLRESLMTRGVLRLFEELPADDIVYSGVHRARFVQPLPLVRDDVVTRSPDLALRRPFLVLNTSMLTCATLNNNEVVRLVDEFVAHNWSALS